MRTDGELEQRERDILEVLVRQHIATGAPVGSKAVVKQLAMPLSTATIRNVMVDLEQAGFLSQPHISAGRVPTDKAYRMHADSLLGSTALEPETQRYISQALSSDTAAPEHLMAKTSRVLSHVSHQVGLVMGPAREEKLLEHIKFMKLPEQRVLAVIVSKPDLVENEVIRLDEEISQEELDRTADFLNTEFHGWSLRAIRVEIFKRLEEMKLLFDRMLRNVATLFMWGALAEEESALLFMDGTSNILDRPEFEDVRKVKELMTTFEEKAKLVRILSACLESAGSGVRVLIGRENPASEMHHCAFIVAPYRYRNRVVGALGVVGPMRMEYAHTIPMVKYVALLCSQLLSAD